MGWSDDLDLLGKRARMWRGSWGLLVAGALAVVVVDREEARLMAEHAEAEAQWQQVQRLQRQQRAQAAAAQARLAQAEAAAGTAPAVAAGRPADAATLQAAQELLRRLAHPWGAALAGVEDAAAGTASGEGGESGRGGGSGQLALLSLTHQVPDGGGAALLQIEAAVADDATAWRLVEALSADARFDDAVLLSRETLAQPDGPLPLRIKLQARLREPGDGADPLGAAHPPGPAHPVRPAGALGPLDPMQPADAAVARPGGARS